MSGAQFAPNPWLRLGRDGKLTLLLDRTEMGQGAAGGLRMLVAEELRVAPEHIAIEFAPVGEAYTNPALGVQMTGGSTSIRAAWGPLRQAAADMRAALVAAAAERWRVPAGECEADQGQVLHLGSNRRFGYGELVAAAARRPLPRAVPVPPQAFRWDGTRQPQPALTDKLTGRVEFGADVQRPGMLTAVVARCPVPGGRIRALESAEAERVAGVHRVVLIERGVAVVADSLWAARRGRECLRIEWDEGPLAGLDTSAIEAAFTAAAERRGHTVSTLGDPDGVVGAKRLAAAYRTPYLAHAPLETMNCTVALGEEECDVWVPTQNQTGTQEAVMALTGLPAGRVRVHTTWVGGGFGRRLETDFVSEAVQVAKTTSRPLQLVWSLEDDFTHDPFRPANLNRLDANLEGNGNPLVWRQHTVGPELALEGIHMPYAIPHQRFAVSEVDPGVPTGAWRSVGASQNAFAVESFIDELAHAAGADPLVFRCNLLRHRPRHRAVLEAAASAIGWASPMAPGRGRGIAVYESYGSWVAQAAEVRLESGGFRVDRVVCAIDCGVAVDPAGVEAQLEGAVAFGLSAALKERITLDGGRVQETDFRRYPLLRYSEMPQVEVLILPSGEPPGGVGEPGVPPVAPAVANALFAASGVRVRRLPLLAHYAAGS